MDVNSNNQSKFFFESRIILHCITKPLYFFLILIFISCCSGAPNTGKYERLKKQLREQDRLNNGQLLTTISHDTSAVVRVHSGGTAMLLCRVHNLGTYSVLWKKNNSILAIDTFTNTPDKRVHASYDQGSNTWMLELQVVRPNDEGQYVCMVSQKPPLTHVVSLQVVPEGEPLVPHLQNDEAPSSNDLEDIKSNITSIWQEMEKLNHKMEAHITGHMADDNETHDGHFYHQHHHENDHFHDNRDSHEIHHDYNDLYDTDDMYHMHFHHHHKIDDHRHGRHFGHEAHQSDHDSHHDYSESHEDSHEEDSNESQNSHNHNADHHHHHDHIHGEHEYNEHDHHGHDHHGHDSHGHDSHSHDSHGHDHNEHDEHHDHDAHHEHDHNHHHYDEHNHLHNHHAHHGYNHHHYHNHHHPHHHEEIYHHGQHKDVIKANCLLEPSKEDPEAHIHGNVKLTQWKNVIYFGLDLSPFDPTETLAKYGFHIHENNITDGKCSTAGGHYNPTGVDHGGPLDKIRHAGDLGNLLVSAQGVSDTGMRRQVLPGVTLEPEKHGSIIGRSIVLHAGEDDFGRGGDAESRTTGNAGGRVSCCTIQVETQEKPKHQEAGTRIRFNG